MLACAAEIYPKNIVANTKVKALLQTGFLLGVRIDVNAGAGIYSHLHNVRITLIWRFGFGKFLQPRPTGPGQTKLF